MEYINIIDLSLALFLTLTWFNLIRSDDVVLKSVTCHQWQPPIRLKMDTDYSSTDTQLCNWYANWRNASVSFATTDVLPLHSIGIDYQDVTVELQNLSHFGNTLTRLRISNSNITEFPCKLFEGLPKIEVLILNYNPISRLPGICTNNMSTSTELQLMKLNLKYNNIHIIPNDAFYGMTKLKIIILDNNLYIADHVNYIISILPESTEEISFQDVELKDEDISRFASVNHLGNLTKLNLKQNFLTIFPQLSRNITNSIQELDIRLNNIISIPQYYLEPYANLEILLLSNNELQDLPLPFNPNATINSKLETFKLLKNLFESISPDSFKGLHNLQRLVLSSNNILDTIGNLSGYFASGCVLEINDVSLICDARIAWMKDGSYSGEIETDEYLCNAPSHLVGIPWENITLAMLYTENHSLQTTPETTPISETTTPVFTQEITPSSETTPSFTHEITLISETSFNQDTTSLETMMFLTQEGTSSLDTSTVTTMQSLEDTPILETIPSLDTTSNLETAPNLDMIPVSQTLHNTDITTNILQTTSNTQFTSSAYNNSETTLQENMHRNITDNSNNFNLNSSLNTQDNTTLNNSATIITRNYTNHHSSTLVATAIANEKLNSPSSEELKALIKYYETPVEAERAVVIGTAAIIFMSVEVVLVLLSDLNHLLQGINRWKSIIKSKWSFSLLD